MQLAETLAQLQSLANPAHMAELARVGINTHNALGIDIYTLRKLAKPLRPDHDLALALWKSGTHEARLLASMVDDPAQAAEAQLEAWAADFDSWDICDQVCDNLFQHTAFAYPKAFEWSGRDEGFVKRAGFVLMACLAFYDRTAPDAKLAQFFPVIQQASDDERNYVKKAVNWALRNLGKRSLAMNAQAVAAAQEIQARGTRAARWIAADALRELTSEKVQLRLRRRFMSHYLSLPKSGAGAGVLVLHAWWGLNDTFRRFCDRLAGEGFVALAPDLYNGAVAATREDANRLMRQMDKDAARKTLNAALKDLAAHPAVDRPAIGVVGFSLGGYYALGLACQKPKNIAAVVTFYGTGRGKFAEAQAAFLGHFAEDDEFEPAADVLELEQHIRQAGKSVVFYTYPGTKHWFFESDRPEYDPAAAQMAWERTAAFLQKELVK